MKSFLNDFCVSNPNNVIFLSSFNLIKEIGGVGNVNDKFNGKL